MNYTVNYFSKLFCKAYSQSNQERFLAWHTKFEKRKALKKALNEKLMEIAWHPKRCSCFCQSEDEKK